MHPEVIRLAKDIHEEFLKAKGYEAARNEFSYRFNGGRIVSRLRGCSDYNRDDALQWRFQIESRILFDDLDYDPNTWPVTWMFGVQPKGKKAGGLYQIEDRDESMPQRIAAEICELTERLLEERDSARAAFEHRLKESKQKHPIGSKIHSLMSKRRKD